MAIKSILVALFGLVLLTACNAPDSNNTHTRSNTTATTNKDSSKQNAKLELVFSDNTYQIIGVAKEAGRHLLVNYLHWSDI